MNDRLAAANAVEFYREVVPFKLMIILAVGEMVLAVMSLAWFLLQPPAGPAGNTPTSVYITPDWSSVMVFVLFSALSILFIQMRKQVVVLTAQGLTASVGPFRYSVPWHNIQGYHIDKRSGFRYGGWGIRMAKVGGRWTLVYSIPGHPRVMLDLNEGRIRRFGFSSRLLDELLSILRQQTGLEPEQ